MSVSFSASARPAYRELAVTMAVTAMIFSVGTAFTTWMMIAIRF
jgi:hypothetical protein